MRSKVARSTLCSRNQWPFVFRVNSSAHSRPSGLASRQVMKASRAAGAADTPNHSRSTSPAFAKSSACLARFRGLARDPVCAGGRTFAHWGAAFCAGAATPGNWAQGECDGPRRRAAGGDGGGCDDGGDGDSGGGHDHSTIPSKSYLVLVFLGVGLFLGTVSLFVIDHFAPGVPYTLALFALGMVLFRAGKGCENPNFKGSYLGRFPLVSADFWTRDHLSERSRP